MQMRGQQCVTVLHLVIGTLLLVKVTEEQGDSVCLSMQYRSLTAELQNEHQCMILEKLQKDFEEDKAHRQVQSTQILSLITSLQHRIVRGLKRGQYSSSRKQKGPALKGIPLVRDCSELYRNGIKRNGVYPIQFEAQLLNVWCDMTTDHGGWTVIQRRQDGELSFAKSWNDYAFGFGDVNAEYWLGNENMHQLTKYQNYSLRVDMWDWENNTAFAMYDLFWISGESDQYRLFLSGYNGTAGDSLAEYHNEMRFSTSDRDNDLWYGSCAGKDNSGWWFRACSFSSLNGVYVVNGTVILGPERLIQGIIWYHWRKDYGYSMKQTEMKIKPRATIQLQRELALVRMEKNLASSTQAPPEPREPEFGVRFGEDLTSVSSKVEGSLEESGQMSKTEEVEGGTISSDREDDSGTSISTTIPEQ